MNERHKRCTVALAWILIIWSLCFVVAPASDVARAVEAEATEEAVVTNEAQAEEVEEEVEPEEEDAEAEAEAESEEDVVEVEVEAEEDDIEVEMEEGGVEVEAELDAGELDDAVESEEVIVPETDQQSRQAFCGYGVVYYAPEPEPTLSVSYEVGVVYVEPEPVQSTSYSGSGYVNANASGTWISAATFRSSGRIYDSSGWSYTYYSQRVLPGGGLSIPGRHVGSEGYVMDGNGNLCLASDDLAYGTVVSVPFGSGTAVVYDCGSGYGNLDVYVDW